MCIRDRDNYDEFLQEYRLRGIVTKYSDYIRYPIRMPVEKSRMVEDVYKRQDLSAAPTKSEKDGPCPLFERQGPSFSCKTGERENT